MSRILFAVLMLLSVAQVVHAQSREQKVRDDRKKVEAEGFWIYNDLPQGFAAAKETGKPLLVVLRCIPCEECVKLDDDLMNNDPVVRPLLEKFVCVRVVATNGLDLSQFQWDTDQSFAVFMLNADGTVYGRFGTRSARTDWLGDVSLPGLAKALQGALTLHAAYPQNKASLAAKRGTAPEFKSPELFPTLKEKYTSALKYEGNVVQSCIHCHQIGDAQRQYYRAQHKPLPAELLFPYPHPKSLGLILDPQQTATVLNVEPNSLAAQTGFLPGDAIRTLAGQPLLSIADVQWVLHNTPGTGGEVTAEIIRAGQPQTLTLKLPAGWRTAGDLSWRSSSWGLRRMTLGGMALEDLPAEERQAAGISADQMALRAKHVGQYGPHAAAKAAGVQKGDIVLEYDGHTDLLREADLFAHGMNQRKPGEKITLTLLRAGKKFTVSLPMQE